MVKYTLTALREGCYQMVVENFICVPLASSIKHRDELSSFCIDREYCYRNCFDVIGLEAYLKRCAWDEDQNNETRIYLIKDSESGDIAAYFGLKAGMVATSINDGLNSEEQERILREKGVKMLPEVLPGIEISHFAVNDNYRRKVGGVKGLREYFYPEFIYPIIEDVASKVGVSLIYLYAAGGDKLISYYKRVFDFQELDVHGIYTPLEPHYDSGCTFMYRVF